MSKARHSELLRVMIGLNDLNDESMIAANGDPLWYFAVDEKIPKVGFVPEDEKARFFKAATIAKDIVRWTLRELPESLVDVSRGNIRTVVFSGWKQVIVIGMSHELWDTETANEFLPRRDVIPFGRSVEPPPIGSMWIPPDPKPTKPASWKDWVILPFGDPWAPIDFHHLAA